MAGVAPKKKVKKKLNRKLKRVVRKSLAAVLLMSAIIIALIPVPKVAADDPTAMASNPADWAYKEIVGSLEGSYSIKIPSGTTPLSALSVGQLSDGTWNLNWEFEYFVHSFDGAQKGVISKYNDEFKKDDVALTTTIKSDYYKVTDAEYNAFFTAEANKTKTLNTPAAVDAPFFEEYFNDSYKTFCTAYVKYEEDLKKWEEELEPDLTKKPQPPATITKTTNDLSETQKNKYYCDNDPGTAGQPTLPKGKYTLQRVKDSRPSGAAGNAAADAYIYLPKGTPDETFNDYKNDANGFAYNFKNPTIVYAIGDGAFKDVKNVTNLTIPQEIKYICDEAFIDSFIENITFTQVSNIGARAFKNCTRLKSVTLTNTLGVIGAEAFCESTISSINFPSNLTNIAYGAFAKCQNLQSVDLSAINVACTIGDYAFFNNLSLNSVTFPGAAESRISKMGKAAFAVDTGVLGSLTEFQYPRTLSEVGSLGDYTLAGRTNLTKVVMPAEYGRSVAVVLPSGTFANCMNLQVVEFPADSSGSSGLVSYGPTSANPAPKGHVFRDVQNPNFYVRGPEFDRNGAQASPRKSTWVATTGAIDEKTGTNHTVPYVYNKNGIDYYEVSNGKYLQQIDGNGVLTSTDFLPGVEAEPIDPLIIPSKVGEQKVLSIADGCFSKKVKDNIVRLIIEDDSVAKIGDNVFRDCPQMKKVTIGNSVNAIGTNAFLNCPKLIEVDFHSPTAGHEGFTIGTDAFKTGSDELTFKGDIAPGYAPFAWATAQENVISQTTSKRVCYKSNSPSNLTVIRDNASNKVTLVDYPFYENIDIDNAAYIKQQDAYFRQKYPSEYPGLVSANSSYVYSIKQKYEKEQAGIQPTKEWEIVNDTERAIIEATKNLVVPAGIQSVDVKGFLSDSKNTANIPYVESYRDINSDLKKNVFKGIGEDKIKADLFKSEKGTPAEEVHPGIFSGYFNEFTALDPKQVAVKGNDRLVSVVLTDVETLPDYAFDSCENLESVTLGKCTDVGTAPFTGCTKLEVVNGNETYVCENGILYSTNPDESKNIVQCLATRGNLIQPISVSVETDPLIAQVSSISEGAFEDCDSLRRVDLTAAAKLQIIPKNCFHNADGLTEVTFPDAVNKIDEDALTGTTKAPIVTIPGKEVLIDNNAFEHAPNGGTIRTYKGSAADKYGQKYGIEVVYIGEKYRVEFLDDDYTELIPPQLVEAGKDATPPPDPVRVGSKFDGWSTSYKNITKDVTIFAKYIKNDGSAFEVYFLDYDGKELCPVQMVELGQNAKAPAEPKREGYTFDGWSKSYVNITANTTIFAKYAGGGDGNHFKVWFLDYDGKSLATVQTVAKGASANPPSEPSRNGYKFDGWSKSYTNITEDTTIVAKYKSNGNNPEDSRNTTKYNAKVISGSGSGDYTAGTIVSISAFAVSDGRVFYKWSTSSNGVGFTGVETATTTFTMPSNNVVITANYGGPKTASSNNTVDKKPGTTTSGNGTSGGSGNRPNRNNTNGTLISITKPGFSNTDVASALVNGSTDNYIIKVTEDAAAQAEIEAALLADAQTLENIKYFPMDISLYDATGTVKVTDTTGISIDITLPVPDELVEYGGNSKVAGVVNGKLDKLTPKFKTIDGVPCMTFTATHFSPYTIYVDTANLTQGTIDDSPTTGDGLHPKWFLVIGLACISGILFVKKDKGIKNIKIA